MVLSGSGSLYRTVLYAAQGEASTRYDDLAMATCVTLTVGFRIEDGGDTGGEKRKKGSGWMVVVWSRESSQDELKMSKFDTLYARQDVHLCRGDLKERAPRIRCITTLRSLTGWK